jgi:hypothetical protein
MSKLTPQQAWEHIKSVWPNATHVCRYGEHGLTLSYMANAAKIDWPEGVDRWPPPEPKYREPTMADVGKMVEVRQNQSQEWKPRTLIYISNTEIKFITLCDDRNPWEWKFARIKDEGAAS